jgi:hypothetical protein
MHRTIEELRAEIEEIGEQMCLAIQPATRRYFAWRLARLRERLTWQIRAESTFN